MKTNFDRCKMSGWGGYVECSICNNSFYLTKKQVQKAKRPICKDCSKVKHGRDKTGWSRITAEIKERDNHQCVKCSSTDELHIHHIDKDNTNNDYKNLITLCKKCHYLEHKTDQCKYLLE